MLAVTPANLRKQCSHEIEEKFFLPTLILEARNYNKMKKDGVRRPFEQKALVVCSYQFAVAALRPDAQKSSSPLSTTIEGSAPSRPATVSQPPFAPEAAGERRYLTVMFCDLVGSTGGER